MRWHCSARVLDCSEKVELEEIAHLAELGVSGEAALCASCIENKYIESPSHVGYCLVHDVLHIRDAIAYVDDLHSTGGPHLSVSNVSGPREACPHLRDKGRIHCSLKFTRKCFIDAGCSRYPDHFAFV